MKTIVNLPSKSLFKSAGGFTNLFLALYILLCVCEQETWEVILVLGGSNAPICFLPTFNEHQKKNPAVSADSLMTLITDWLHMWHKSNALVYKCSIQSCFYDELPFVITESWVLASGWVSFIFDLLNCSSFLPLILSFHYGCNWLFQFAFFLWCEGLICSLILGLVVKKVLLVYAHQSSGSFNAAAKDAAVEILTAQGCTVEVSDLYSMKFKATATAEDITGTELSHW